MFKYLSLKLLDKKGDIPYQNGEQTETQNEGPTKRQTEFVVSRGAVNKLTSTYIVHSSVRQTNLYKFP